MSSYTSRNALESLTKLLTEELHRRIKYGFREYVVDLTDEGLTAARRRTHVATGYLKRAHYAALTNRPDTYEGTILIGRWFNPNYAKRIPYTNEYGVVEHEKGGKHAFYELTWRNFFPQYINKTIRQRIFELFTEKLSQ